MGKFQHYDGNAGAYRWGDFWRFSTTSTNKKTMVMTYDTSKSGAYDATQSPYKITFKTKKVKYETDDDGNQIVTAGKLVKIIYHNLNGDKIGEFSGLKVEWSFIDDYFRSGDTGQIGIIIFGGGHKFIGANNTKLVPGGGYEEGDSINTGWGNDRVKAKGGRDYISDHGGKDYYDGGAGDDTVSYESVYWEPQGVKSGIIANLGKGFIKGPDGFTDTIVNIERVRGTYRKDKFIGDDNDNEFTGLNGRDSIDGGAGYDMVRYDKDASQGGYSGIRVDLAAGTIRDGFRRKDKVTNVEAVRGTEKRDIMKDDAKDNYFDGRGGNDVFTFTQGNDVAKGGSGFDTFIFKGNAVGNNTIRDFTQGEDKIDIISVTNFGELTLSYTTDGALIEFTAGSVFLDGITEVTSDFFAF